MIDINKFPYSKPRKGQQYLIENVLNKNDQYRYYICELPTGFGKSPVAINICRSYKNAFLITSTKQLQDQYMDDFKQYSIKSIKGKANYPCGLNNKLNCENGFCVLDKQTLVECKKEHKCPYYNAREKALKANIALTSYQYFLRAGECAGFWKPRNVIIFDECHLLEDQIVNWAKIVLSVKELSNKYKLFEKCNLQDFVKISNPPKQSGFKPNKTWLNQIYNLLFTRRNEKYEEIKNIFGLNCDPDSLTPEQLDMLYSNHKDYYELDKLYKKLNVFYQCKNENDWLIDPHEDGLELTPINISTLFHFYIKKFAIDKIYFMSATILDLPGFRKTFGLPKEKTLLVKTDSPFDPKNSPIIYDPICKMDYQHIQENLDKIVKAVEDTIKKHPDEKGIIHTGNYFLAKNIVKNINSDRLIMKEQNESNEDLIKRHINSNKPTILVSPSLNTGVDLKDDLSRFQIILKMPWKSLQDKRVQAKNKFDRHWYAVDMFKTLVQSTGRSTRSKDDHSITYVLDKSFKWWISHYKNKGWFSPKFLKRIKYADKK